MFVSGAVLVGFLISYYFYTVLSDKINVKVISIFQTGVYSNYDEALLACDSKNKIFYDGKLYHVYDSIVSSDKAKQRMIQFYENNNIEYYVKTKYVTEDMYDDISKYSTLIEMSDNDTLKIINKQVIEKYGADTVWVI